VKVALPVVRGLHGSRTEGTTRRFKVGDFKTEFNGLGVLRTDIRTLPGRRRGDRIGERSPLLADSLSSWVVAYSIALLREPERPAGTPLATTITQFSPAVTMS